MTSPYRFLRYNQMSEKPISKCAQYTSALLISHTLCLRSDLCGLWQLPFCPPRLENKTDDGVFIYVHNEGYGRANQSEMKSMFGDDPASASMKNGARIGARRLSRVFRLRMDSMYG